MKRLGLFFILTVGVIISSYGQQRTIYGTVISSMDGKPVKGVKIILVEEKADSKANEIIRIETQVKTKTNEKGEYKLTVPDTWENYIRFKKFRYSTTDVKLGNRTELNLSMTIPVRQKD